MELTKEIQHFRSEALMSRYENAIQSGDALIRKFEILQKISMQDFTELKQQIKIEVEYCVELNKFVNKEIRHQSSNQKNSKAEQTKNVKQKSSWSRKDRVNQSSTNNQNEIMTWKEQITSTNSQPGQTVEQKIHKHVILPLNMPFFKLKSSVILIKAQNCLDEVSQYLFHYQFRQFETLKMSDLGVQNILNFKNQMIETNYTRGLIVIQQQSKPFGEKQIPKLVKVLQAYRQSDLESQKLKQVVLVLLVAGTPQSPQDQNKQPIQRVQFF